VYDSWVRSKSERRRLRDTGNDDAVQKYRHIEIVEKHVCAEEVAAMSGEIVVDGKTRLHVERLCCRRLNNYAQQQIASTFQQNKNAEYISMGST